MKEINKAISANLKVLRNIYGYSVQDIEQKTGCEDYAAYESGEKTPSIDELIVLSDLFDIDIDKIVREPLTTFLFRSANFSCIDNTYILSRHEK